MKKQINIILALFMTIGTTACGQNVTDQAQPASPKVALTERDQLQQDIGEMLLVGFRGTTINENSHIVRDITEYHVGNVILFEYDAPTGTRHRNISSPNQVKELCNDLQKYAKGHLLIGVDQEGGTVTRLRTQDGFPKTLSAQASAQAGEKSVVENALVIAQELSAAGINLNFAPCVDVNTNPNCPIIGKLGRSFSSVPTLVARYARHWIDVQSKQGIISCLKHFPGHGSATGDTHAGLVDVTKTWQESELKPYRELIEGGGVEMIMVAHVINQQLGGDLPASLSPLVVREKLRNELGFNGVVVTDDLAMGAITKHYGLEEALKMAILAGCDMLCLSNNGGGTYDPELVPHAVEAITQMVENGELKAEDSHAAAERIRALKKAHSIK
jgi:beta-N-acetylhexosaminidase